MGEKSNQKRQLILETARRIFMEKGYKDVTMKDIVEACGISRGGLYLYFSSTKEIFAEVLAMESQEKDDVFSQGIPGDAAASDILALFLKEQKKEILRRKNSLTVATYEYFFENKVARKENILRSRFEEAVAVMEKLITDGVENGEFYCEDPWAARAILCLSWKDSGRRPRRWAFRKRQWTVNFIISCRD